MATEEGGEKEAEVVLTGVAPVTLGGGDMIIEEGRGRGETGKEYNALVERKENLYYL